MYEAGGGGSCWINAALQAIFAPLRSKALLSQLWEQTPEDHRAPLLRRAFDKSFARRTTLASAASVSDRLVATFASLYTPPLTETCAPYLCTEEFYHGTQEDAAEFVTQLLHDDACATHIRRLFEGLTVQTMTCSSSTCKLRRAKAATDEFDMLQLPLLQERSGIKHKLYTVQEALDAYSEPELVHYDAEPCARCGNTAFWKADTATLTPDVLVLCVKRWADPEEPLLHPVEVTDAVTFQSVTYSLRAVVVHLGDSIHAGHYITIAKHAAENGTWWLYDDGVRKEATEEQRRTLCKYGIRTMKSYLMVYEK